jgi:hypothetical protein
VIGDDDRVAAVMTPAERAASTVDTSGEHCPMCAAAHAWVGLGADRLRSRGGQKPFGSVAVVS